MKTLTLEECLEKLPHHLTLKPSSERNESEIGDYRVETVKAWAQRWATDQNTELRGLWHAIQDRNWSEVEAIYRRLDAATQSKLQELRR